MRFHQRICRPGEQVATNPLMESHPVSEEIAWSRNAEAHLALLQQSAAAPTPIAPQNPTTAREAFEVASIRQRTSMPAGGRGGPPGGGCLGFPQVDHNRFVATGASVYSLI